MMSEFLPIKPIYTGVDVTALGEPSPDDVMRAPGGGIKFPDGSLQITAVGLAGPQGEEGLSAYEVAVTNGYPGTEAEWLDSLVGAPGAAGADSTVPGPAGPAGADSTVPGPQGPAGADSTVPGPVGPAGPSAVSLDAGNTATLGTDNLIFVPATSTSALEARVAALEAAMAQLLPWTKL